MDLCPHRFAPLSMGIVKDGHVQCPYHGLEFDGTGRCVHNPHGNGARPAALDVRVFPLVERDGLVWIWPGVRDRADPATIPDYSCRIAPDRRNVGGYAHVDCDFRLLVDNLMDLGHAQYVHRANAQSDAFDRVRRQVIVEGETIHNNMMFPATSPTVFVTKVLGQTNHEIDMWTNIPLESGRRDAQPRRLRARRHASRGEFEHAGHAHRDTRDRDDMPLFLRRSAELRAARRRSRRCIPRVAETGAHAGGQADGSGDPASRARHPTPRLKPAMLACDEAAVRVSRTLDRMLLGEAA